ncbi:MAG: hypothetical protein OXT65_04525 [Alphaproteobacteria bacterium]|nr:hypothetical protein [Alphaproteobacteria bacterium]
MEKKVTALICGFAAMLMLVLPCRADAAQLQTSQSKESAVQRARNLDVPPGLRRLVGAGGDIEYAGQYYGLDAWRIIDKNKEGPQRDKYAYVTKEGGMLLGILTHPDGTVVTDVKRAVHGKNVAGRQAALPGAAFAHSQSARTEKVYAQVEAAHWVSLGQPDAPYIYAFINTHCDHCKEYWRALENAVSLGQLQVRLIPFGRMGQNRHAGAALLEAKDPLKVWSDFVRGNESALAAVQPSQKSLQNIDRNSALFTDWKIASIPFTLYRRPADGRILAVQGVPDNILVLLSDLTGKG